MLLEAIAAGVPFVASELSALTETTGRKGGLFFKPLDPRDLADKLLSHLRDEKLRDNLAREGAGRAKDFDWEKLTERIERVCTRGRGRN